MDTVPAEVIEKKILLIRTHKVMLDADLAFLYGVETKVLIQAVKRNIKRFPKDFMFRLTKEEFGDLRSQIVTSSWAAGDIFHMHLRSRGLQCSQACLTAIGLSRSILR